MRLSLIVFISLATVTAAVPIRPGASQHLQYSDLHPVTTMLVQTDVDTEADLEADLETELEIDIEATTDTETLQSNPPIQQQKGAQGNVKKAFDTGLNMVKQVIVDIYDYVRSGVQVTWDGVKWVG